MRKAYELVARLGAGADELLAATRATPRYVWEALTVRRYRFGAAAVLLVYFVLYLFALGDLDVSTSGRFDRFAAIPSAQVVPDWQEKVFAARAPFLYEPVAVVYVLPQLAVFVSVGNILLGSFLGLLLGVNVALALNAAARVQSCRRRGVYTSALGVLPTFLMGFACCAPAFLLALGANVAAALVPIFIPLRSFLLPLAVALMGGMLLWSVRRLRTAELELAALRRRPAAPQPPAREKRERALARR